jgi:hypothetical protein
MEVVMMKMLREMMIRSNPFFPFFIFIFNFQKPIISFLINKKIEKSEKARWEKKFFFN